MLQGAPINLIDQDLSCNQSQQSTPSPQICFDERKFLVYINGVELEYGKQVLTPRGLEIYDQNDSHQAPDDNLLQYIVEGNNPFSFDRKLSQHKYCQELAEVLDRATNRIYQIIKASKKCTSQGKDSYSCMQTLKICEIIMKKIPLKLRCFESVIKQIPIIKVKILFENNSFFIQVIKFLCQIVFKVSIQTIDPNQKAKQNIDEDSQQSFINEGSESEQKKTDDKMKKGKTGSRNPKVYLSSYELKVVQIYEYVKKSLEKVKLGYERVNLILNIFTPEHKLSAFLFDLNRQLVEDQLSNNIEETFGSNQQKNQQVGTAKKQRSSNALRVERSILQILSKVVLIIRTINTSICKSEISFKMVRGYLITQQSLISWLRGNLEGLKSSVLCGRKFLQLFHLLIDIYPMFVSGFYNQHQNQINYIISFQFINIYETLYMAHADQKNQQKSKQQARNCLQNLIGICRASIKQTTSLVNIGRVIAKQMCGVALSLRPSDIQFLTHVCCVNQHSRGFVLKFLFSFYRKFITQFKQKIKRSLGEQIKCVRQNKLHFVEILQSIRKMSEIQTIDFSLDEELMRDIQQILKVYIDRWQGNCLLSIFEAMKNVVKVENSKDRD